jgi:hypothetical protein
MDKEQIKGISACEEIDRELETFKSAYDILNGEHTLLLKTIGLKENATHTQIVKACEEILNHNHSNDTQPKADTIDEAIICGREGQEESLEIISKDTPVSVLINQALSQRNQEILKVIYPILESKVRPDIWTREIIINTIYENIKKQLTTTSEGKDE